MEMKQRNRTGKIEKFLRWRSLDMLSAVGNVASLDVYSVQRKQIEDRMSLLGVSMMSRYVYGDGLPDNSELVVRRCLNCTSDIETSYFSAKCRRYLPPVCVNCGIEDELLDDNNSYIAELYIPNSQSLDLFSVDTMHMEN